MLYSIFECITINSTFNFFMLFSMLYNQSMLSEGENHYAK
jgi:hypothetical protein